MAEAFWIVERGLMDDMRVGNDTIRSHMKCRYANTLDMIMSGSSNSFKQKYRISGDTVRVELLPNGCYDILTLDTIWDKGYKGTYESFEALPEELQRKLAVINMLKPPPASDGQVEGVGRKISQNICWVYLDKT